MSVREVFDPPCVKCALCGTTYGAKFKVGQDGGWVRFDGFLYMLCKDCQPLAQFSFEQRIVVSGGAA